MADAWGAEADAWVGEARRLATSADRLLFALALVAALALKAHYGTATAHALRWILAPTAALVSGSTGAPFVFEAAGYLSPELGLLIAPVCAGVNFLVVVFCSGVFGLAPLIPEARAKVLFAAGWVGVSYGATILANAARILVGLELRAVQPYLTWLTAGELHRLEGVVVYVSALCGLFLLARAVVVRRLRARPA